MQERNVDKIRRLKKELFTEKERRHNADLEIMRMHKVVDHIQAEAVEQARELSVAVDGVVIALALRYGANVGDGVWEVSLPVYSATELCGAYTVSGERAGERYVYRVEKVKGK